MAVDHTTDTLLNSIKARITIPSSQNLFTDSDILLLANEELESVIVPMIMRIRWEFFVTFIDHALDGTTEFPFPASAIAGNIRDVTVVDNNGNERQLSLISQELRTSGGLWPAAFNAEGFFIRGNTIYLTSDIQQGSSLRVYYPRRPNSLVKTSETGQILDINTSTNMITLGNVPVDWTTADTLDVVSNVPGFDLTVMGASISAISSPTITVDAATTAELIVGDWFCLEGESSIPQIPVETHPILAQSTAVKLLEAMGDRTQVEVSEGKLGQLMTNYYSMSPRIEGQPKRLATRKGIGSYVHRGRFRNLRGNF